MSRDMNLCLPFPAQAFTKTALESLAKERNEFTEFTVKALVWSSFLPDSLPFLIHT